MTVQEIIDQALRQGDNVSPTSADYLERRRLALSFLRELVDEVWWLRDWPWKKKNTTVIVPAATGYVNLPLDFNSMGVYGGVYDLNGRKLDEVPESVVFDLRASSYNTDSPRYYSLHNQDEVTYLGRIQIPINVGPHSLVLFYQSNPPFMMDAGDSDAAPDVAVSALAFDSATGIATATATDHGFENGQQVVIVDDGNGDYDGSFPVTVEGPDAFTFTLVGSSPVDAPTATATLDIRQANRAVLRVPSKYHQTVLTWGLRAKLRESKGDARFEFAQGEFAKNLTHMLKEEARAQGSMRQLPSFFGSDRSTY